MRSLCTGVILLAWVTTAAAQAAGRDMAAAAKPQWSPVGPNLGPGAETAVLQGDPSQPSR
jgi:hypothetical protein